MKTDAGEKKRTPIKSLFLVFSCLLLLTGCWDAREIEERSIVTAIAVDEAQDGKVAVTVQIPVPLKIAGGEGGGGGGGKPVAVLSATGRTFLEALEEIRHRTSEKLFFGQTTLIAFSKSKAKKGIKNVLDSLRRMPQFRRMLYPVVVEEGKASRLLSVQTSLEKVPSNFVKKMIRSAIRVGNLPQYTLGHFYNSLYNKAKQPAMITLKVQKKGEIIATGVAAFQGTHLVGTLNRQETGNLLRLSKEDDGGELTFKVKGKKGHIATFRPKLVDTNYAFSYKNGIVHVKVDIFAEGQLQEITFPYNISNQKKRVRLKKNIEQTFEKRSLATVHKLQAYGTDILGFGVRLRAFHYDIWKKVDWDKAFSKAKVDVNYDVQVRRSGMELRNASPKSE